MAGAIPKSGTLDKTQVGKKPPAKKAPAKKAPGKAVAKVAPKPVDKGDFTPAKAKAHTARIQKGLESAVELLHEAWKGRIWLALGLKNWDEYIKQEFGSAPLALPMEKRKPTSANLAERGWSSRAIAAATGVDQKTVVRDINEANAAEAELRQNASVAADDNIIDGEVVSEEKSQPESRTVTGLDGKEREVTAKPAKEPAVKNIVSQARDVKKKLEAVIFDLGELYDRDEYEANMVAVDKVLQQPFDDFVDCVTPERLGFETESDEAEPELVGAQG
jgi:hypothetical protein